MNIYIIGLPTVGKSTLGKMLANKLNYSFIDTDSLIEEKYNKKISELFKKEEEFRDLETKIISDLKSINNTVVSLGGGSVLRSINVENLYGLIIYLNPPLEQLTTRDKSNRPILEMFSLQDLYKKRHQLYQEVADYEFNSTNNAEIINEIEVIMKKEKKKILVINGPNMNLLHKRDCSLYGSMSLNDINEMMIKYDLFDIEFFQSNYEGAIIEKIHTLDNYDYLIINAAAFTHTSIAIKDALDIFNNVKVEVHLSDINNREDYRMINFIKESCNKQIAGYKEFSYLKALNYLKKISR